MTRHGQRRLSRSGRHSAPRSVLAFVARLCAESTTGARERRDRDPVEEAVAPVPENDAGYPARRLALKHPIGAVTPLAIASTLDPVLGPLMQYLTTDLGVADALPSLSLWARWTARAASA